jgi:hypothetical protein
MSIVLRFHVGDAADDPEIQEPFQEFGSLIAQILMDQHKLNMLNIGLSREDGTLSGLLNPVISLNLMPISQ